jgi:hypothetical protein
MEYFRLIEPVLLALGDADAQLKHEAAQCKRSIETPKLVTLNSRDLQSSCDISKVAARVQLFCDQSHSGGAIGEQSKIICETAEVLREVAFDAKARELREVLGVTAEEQHLQTQLKNKTLVCSQMQ